MSDPIVNRVSESGLISLDLEEWYPKQEIATFDLKDYLFMGLILKEKDFRESLKALDWKVYQDQAVAVFCSADAVIPAWAYMLVATYLTPVAKDVYQGTPDAYRKELFHQQLSQIDPEQFRDQRIVVKGCGDLPIGPDAYLMITRILQPVAKSIMYGEPCSTVPIYKKPK